MGTGPLDSDVGSLLFCFFAPPLLGPSGTYPRSQLPVCPDDSPSRSLSSVPVSHAQMSRPSPPQIHSPEGASLLLPDLGLPGPPSQRTQESKPGALVPLGSVSPSPPSQVHPVDAHVLSVLTCWAGCHGLCGLPGLPASSLSFPFIRASHASQGHCWKRKVLPA